MGELAAIRSLQELEAVIGRGIKSFIDTGLALAEIRDQRLYRVDFATFEDYCQKKWNWTRQRSNQLIDAARVAVNLTTIVVKPLNEAQARELVRLPPDRQREIAATIDFQQITAAEIRARVKDVLQSMKSQISEAKPGRGWSRYTTKKIEDAIVRAAALPQPISRAQLHELLGSKAKSRNDHQWKRVLKLLPWVRVRFFADDRLELTIIKDLREICRREHRGGELPMEFLVRFFKEFMHRRKEADLANKKRIWNPDAICKVDLIEILTWVEDEVQSYINGTPANARGNTDKPSKTGARLKHDHETTVRINSADAGTGAAV